MWFDLGNNTWRKYRRTFQDHSKYIHNYIVKSFRISILQYDEADWAVGVKKLSENDIHVATRDRLPTSMQDELDDKSQDY